MISTWKVNKHIPPAKHLQSGTFGNMHGWCANIVVQGKIRVSSSPIQPPPSGTGAVQWPHLFKSAAQGMSRFGGPSNIFYEKLSMPKTIYLKNRKYKFS